MALFPPYTGGCIVKKIIHALLKDVSSLYGRVYRYLQSWKMILGCFLPIREGVSERVLDKAIREMFPPYTGGCIERLPKFI